MVEDIVNSGFHLGAAIFTFYNCWIAYQQKEVKGVSKLTVVFMITWGVWNLYYFTAINQPFTWYMNIVIMSANALWLILAMRYSNKEKLDGQQEDSRGG
jgi:hypothetical protein